MGDASPPARMTAGKDRIAKVGFRLIAEIEASEFVALYRPFGQTNREAVGTDVRNVDRRHWRLVHLNRFRVR